MRATDIIMKKRGIKGLAIEPLNREEIEFIVNSYVRGEIPEYQISAWLMAVYFNGMTFEETAILTDVMLHSGKVMDLSGLEGPFVDKHSTGGVGDKLSLPLAPIVAANGVKVPMMSGRALGHTGGTLDKLEAVTGYRTNLTEAEFRNFIEKTGFAMTGQTKEIVPADRLLYAMRDVTATVESVPLITSSILSKKVAEGSEALVFDVKCGKGAFMKTLSDAEALAVSLVGTAKAMGKKARALITNMNEPLGTMAGNFLEIEETIDILKGQGPADSTELTLQLAAHMLVLGGKAKTEEEGLSLAKEAVSSGKALDPFIKNIETKKRRTLCSSFFSDWVLADIIKFLMQLCELPYFFRSRNVEKYSRRTSSQRMLPMHRRCRHPFRMRSMRTSCMQCQELLQSLAYRFHHPCHRR